jgi:hypothetical protein
MRKMSIEKVANFAIIVACAALAAQVGSSIFRAQSPPSPLKPYARGASVRPEASLQLQSSSRTLILYTNSFCHFCTDSMAFYRRVAMLAKESGVRLLAVTSERPLANEAYLSSHGVNVQKVISAKDTSLSLHATPTLILVRSDGHVIDSWLGKLTGGGEAEVTRLVSQAH